MTDFELMDSVINCDNIEIGMKNLLNLVINIDKDRYTSKLLDEFYKRMQIALMLLHNWESVSNDEDEDIFIAEGNTALTLYIVLTIPQHKKPRQTLDKIKKYAEDQMNIFEMGSGKIVSESRLREIIRYFNESYDFVKKVLRCTGKKIPFLILDLKHKNYYSELKVTKYSNELYFCFFFYLIEMDQKINVEEEVFYMFSSALVARYIEDVEDISVKLISIFKEICVPKIEELSQDTQRAVLTQLLSIGLMYNSPYEKYDSSDHVAQKDKKIFKQIAEQMIERIPYKIIEEE